MMQQMLVEVPQVKVVELNVHDPVQLQTQIRALQLGIKYLEVDGVGDEALLMPLRRQLAALVSDVTLSGAA